MSKTLHRLRAPNLLSIASIVFAVALPACGLSADDGATDEPKTSEATGEIILGSAGHWSGSTSIVTATWQAAQVGTINGTTVMVRAGTCGDFWDCTVDRTSLAWRQFEGGTDFTDLKSIGNMSTHDKVSLAAFNGYLYMIHMGGSDDDQNTTWITKFNPATGVWQADRQIAYPTNYSVPAIVAFNNKLYFIGTTNTSPYTMWYATMDTNENFSSMNMIPSPGYDHQTIGRINATVAFGKLFYTHRWGQTTDIVYGTFDGTSWSPVDHIYGGTNNSPLQGFEAAIAFDGSRLHLIHTRVNDTYVWWTQFDNCNWSTTESQIGGIQSELSPALAAGGPGLMMLTEDSDPQTEGGDYNVNFATYSPPTFSIICTVAHQ